MEKRGGSPCVLRLVCFALCWLRRILKGAPSGGRGLRCVVVVSRRKTPFIQPSVPSLPALLLSARVHTDTQTHNFGVPSRPLASRVPPPLLLPAAAVVLTRLLLFLVAIILSDLYGNLCGPLWLASVPYSHYCYCHQRRRCCCCRICCIKSLFFFVPPPHPFQTFNGRGPQWWYDIHLAFSSSISTPSLP